MKRRITLLFVLCALISCAKKNMEKESTMEVLKQAAEEKYDPPADKKITEKQMQMYLAVHKRELEIARNAAQRLEEKGKQLKAKDEKPGFMDALNALSDVGKFWTADLRAAKELGYNTAEYQWVKGQVLEASITAMSEGFEQAANKMVEQSMQSYRSALAKARSPEEKKMLEEQMAALNQQQSEMNKSAGVSEDIRHNREIVRKYQGELDAIKSEMEKFNKSK
ncbi:MAG TPA: hypothetical protein VGK99_17075 [Acidobacteriota bacterium]|jgi:hypothetical protein